MPAKRPNATCPNQRISLPRSPMGLMNLRIPTSNVVTLLLCIGVISTTEVTPAGAPALFLEKGEALALTGKTLIFNPVTGSRGYQYSACIRDSATGHVGLFPISPEFSTPLLTDPEPFVTGSLLTFPDTFVFPFFGVNYTKAFVNIRGDIVFSDVTRSRTRPSLADHRSAPRLSALLSFLQWSQRSSVRWQAAGDRVVITYRDMREAKRFRGQGDPCFSSFQVSLFRNGTISTTYLRAEANGPRVVGLSSGGPEPTAELRINFTSACTYNPAPRIGTAACVATGGLATGELGAAVTAQSDQAEFSGEYYDSIYYDYVDYNEEDANDTLTLGQIVGGLDTPEGRYPYVVNLVSAVMGENAKPFCGGVLINPTVVISAAHCLSSGQRPTDVLVHVGRHDLRNELITAEQVYQVEEIAVHYAFKQRTQQDNDVMLMRLKTPVTVPGANKPEMFPLLANSRFQSVAPGTPYTIIGWGLTAEGGLMSAVQQMGEVGHVTRGDCEAVYGAASITDSMFCAGSNGADACQGDSGGPILRTTSDGDDYLGGSNLSQPTSGHTNSTTSRFAYLAKVVHSTDEVDRAHRAKDCTGVLVTASAVLTSAACAGATSVRVGPSSSQHQAATITVTGSTEHLVGVLSGEEERHSQPLGVLLYRLATPYTAFQPVLLDRGEYSRDLVPGLALTAVSYVSSPSDLPGPASVRQTNLTFVSAEWSDAADVMRGLDGRPLGDSLISCARETPREVPCGDATRGSPLLAMPRADAYWADVLLGVALQPQNCSAAVGAQQIYARVSTFMPWLEGTLAQWARDTAQIVPENAGEEIDGEFVLRIVAGDRIVGGTEVQPVGRYPFLVNLSRLRSVLCGGSLITPNVVLSAAHCYVRGLEVTAGQHRLYDPSMPGVTRAVVDVAIHEDFTSRPVKDYDIMLLRLEEAIPAQVAVPIALASSRLPPHPTPLTVMGWGRTAFQGRTSRILQEVEVDLVPQAQCRQLYGSFVISGSMMCAAREGADACAGDSGGPLLVRGQHDSADDIQVGIVSFGVGCADERYPGVYTDVATMRPWIEERLAAWGLALPCSGIP
eukprot:jgi/Tetstr1/427746/TSEL_017868.t1